VFPHPLYNQLIKQTFALSVSHSLKLIMYYFKLNWWLKCTQKSHLRSTKTKPLIFC
jgi:hypothetical protein